ncbi:histone H1 [Euphorbia lathyris]|uniref:histone H1 n=1 Tax=Euphorbia lathyris TaxID=212925 RepID=UPI003313A8B7
MLILINCEILRLRLIFMATDQENVAAATVEQPLPEPEPEPEPVKDEKEKKPRAAREKKPKQPKTASHPPYFQMIKEAVTALNEKSGSSPYAIAKYMEEKHKAVLPANFKKILGLQLKNSAARGKLIKIKASYKLSETGKKGGNNEMEKNKKKKPQGGRRISRRKTRSVNKKTEAAAKKPKKSTSGKAKQPKSIKSPASKRTRKSAAMVASAS